TEFNSNGTLLYASRNYSLTFSEDRVIVVDLFSEEDDTEDMIRELYEGSPSGGAVIYSGGAVQRAANNSIYYSSGHSTWLFQIMNPDSFQYASLAIEDTDNHIYLNADSQNRYCMIGLPQLVPILPNC